MLSELRKCELWCYLANEGGRSRVVMILPAAHGPGFAAGNCFREERGRLVNDAARRVGIAVRVKRQHKRNNQMIQIRPRR